MSSAAFDLRSSPARPVGDVVLFGCIAALLVIHGSALATFSICARK